MPDWTAPFHLPGLKNEEFEKQKKAYELEHGYSITVPGIEDIIKINWTKPMTPDEEMWYRQKKWHLFSSKRLADLRELKAKKKERYNAMLASPQPKILRSAGSILTAADDAQDAISTLAVAGKLAMKAAPKILGKILTGPVGALTTMSDALNMVQAMGTFCMAPMMGKRSSEKMTKTSPRHRKSKLKRAAKLKNWSPNKGDALQLLQTTEQVFGVGISLGPIMGFVQDIAAGAVRTALGQKVTIKEKPPKDDMWIWGFDPGLKAVSTLWGFIHETDEDEILLTMAVEQLAYQHQQFKNAQWNPLEQVDFSDGIEIRAPWPKNPITQEVIMEGPEPPERVLAWPQTGTMWANMEELEEVTTETATKNLTSFMDRNKHSWKGYLGGLCAVNGADYAMASAEGEENLEYDYSVPSKVATMLLENQIMLDPDQPDDRFDLLNAWLEDLDANNDTPALKDIVAFCEASHNDIKLIRHGK